MSESDWWVCSHCKSLNSLSARKCYSCRKGKSKTAERASHLLNYRSVVSWDGKVRLEQRTEEAEEAEETAKIPPLRVPVPRAITAVAPRPPEGARITYLPPPVPPAAPMPSAWVRPGPPPGADVLQPSMALSGPPPVVPVGPGLQPIAALPAPPPFTEEDQPRWSHWDELLDLPTPDAERLRVALGVADAESSGVPADVAGGDRARPGAIQDAIMKVRDQRDSGPRAAPTRPEADQATAPIDGPELDEIPDEPTEAAL